jgi:hypothetical protein
MESPPIFYTLLLVSLLWLCFMLHVLWPDTRAGTRPMPPAPTPPPRKRSKDPQPFAGLIHKPLCAACEQATDSPPKAPGAPPPLIASTRGRQRTVDTQEQFCPGSDCSYAGWTGRGNIRANGHPGGKPWRQLQCVSCHGYFQETHGTIFHGKRVSPDLLVWAVGALAEGLGIRAVARVFEVDPNTVLQWLVEVADQLQAFSQYFLHDVHVPQVQLDELYALLSAVKEGIVSEAEAITRLSRSPHWIWVAIDPVSKLLLTLNVGDRTLAMAHSIIHQVVQVLAPGCVPLFLTDGFKEYTTALLAHFGQWVQPARRQATGPWPKPRWMPQPQLLYAQVIKVTRQRRLVRVRHRVVFGTLGAIEQGLAAHGWHINTAFIERVNLGYLRNTCLCRARHKHVYAARQIMPRRVRTIAKSQHIPITCAICRGAYIRHNPGSICCPKCGQ